jgi:uncharacterized protein
MMKGGGMHYRRFGRLDWQVSALGFGAMRLPLVDKKDYCEEDAAHEPIDEVEATRLLRRAIDQGVNYVDTAYVYHGEKSEGFVGGALKGGYREKVRIATKLPVWKVAKPDDTERYFSEQLERLDVPAIDFYLIHSLDADSWQTTLDMKVLDWAERALADGRIGQFGFSFHDDYEVFEKIVDGSDLWSFCQIQYNYMDAEYQAGTRGLEYAAEKGLGVVVMEPVRGGQLARRPPEAVAAHWAAANAEREARGLAPRAPVEWALHWVWDHPAVSTVLSGMSTMEQVEQNVAAAAESAPQALTAAEMSSYARVREAYRGLTPVPCTSCGYCLPCPNGVKIPDVFEIYNDRFLYDHLQMARMYYDWLEECERADKCIRCGECEPKCPQKIEIMDWLEKAHALLAPEKE